MIPLTIYYQNIKILDGLNALVFSVFWPKDLEVLWIFRKFQTYTLFNNLSYNNSKNLFSKAVLVIIAIILYLWSHRAHFGDLRVKFENFCGVLKIHFIDIFSIFLFFNFFKYFYYWFFSPFLLLQCPLYNLEKNVPKIYC